MIQLKRRYFNLELSSEFIELYVLRFGDWKQNLHIHEIHTNIQSLTLFEPPSIYEKFYRHRIRCPLTCSWSKINCYITLCPESKMLVRKVVHLMWFINLLYEERQFLSFVLVHVEKLTKCQGFFYRGSVLGRNISLYS